MAKSVQPKTVARRLISDLTYDPENARKHSEVDIEAIAKSLEKFNQQSPIVITPEGVVVKGNGTMMAAQKLGWTEIDAVVTYLTGEELRAYAIADNQIDNEDKQRPQYEALYGDRVKVFDKKAYADHVDEGDNFDSRRTTTHARNACFDIAEELGYEWFLVLDDDYQIFEFRVDGEGQYSYFTMGKQLEAAIEAVLEFFKSIPAKSIALAQGGDFIGGSESSSARSAVPKRKVMNTFFCSTSRRFSFFSRLNEDVNTYLALGFTGDLFLTVMLASVVQTNTQKNPGGMSDAYLESGTYVKSFYSVMYAPHSVKISMMGQSNRRIHHRVNWKTAVPQIVSESCRKV